MARISAYPLNQPAVTDNVIGTKMPADSSGDIITSQFTVQSIVSLVNAANIPISNVGLSFKWSSNDSTYRESSTHIGTNGIYSKLRVDFDNLILEEGSTYKLLIERNKRPGRKSSSPVSYRQAGYKTPDLTQALPAPYTERLSEIVITAVSGQIFDFKFDLFFRAAGGSGFPTPAGYSYKQQLNSDKQMKVLPIAFRIQETKAGVVTTSSILGELSMIGIIGKDNNDAPNQVVTFKHR